MYSSAPQSVRRAVLALGCSLGALGIAGPAWAQTPDQAPAPEAQAAAPADTANANAGNDQEEIVVTAQFREQRLQDTPLAITAVNSALLQARSQTNVTEITNQAPSVQIRPQGASFGPSVTASIRGVGQGDFNPAFEPGVGIYVDDVYFPQLTGAVFDLLDLDRVEILRGPQGTLAGRNSEGGAIKLYSKKPTGQGGGYVEATYGSRNRIGLRAGADFTIAPDLYARVAGVYKQQDGYVSRLDFGCVHPAGSDPLNPAGGVPRTQPAGHCLIDKMGGVGYGALRGTVRYAPTTDIELTVIGDYTHDEHTIPGEVLIAVSPINNPNTNPAPGVIYDNRFICGKFCNYQTTGQPAAIWHGILGDGTPLLATSGTDKSKYDSWGVSGHLHWALSDQWAIENILAYQHFKTSFDADDDLSPANLGFGQNKLTHWNWSEELRLNGKIGDTIDVTVGGYYFKQSTTYNSYQDLRYVSVGGGIPLFPLQFVQPDVINADSKAVFANAGWEIVPNLNLNGGLRYTEESKDYHYFRLNPDGTINPFLDPVGAANGAGTPGALTGAVARYKGDRVDWRASLDYRFAPELMVYGSVSTGFKGGGTNPRPFFASQVISFNPETLTNYEIGFKSDLFDRKVRFNVSAFYDEYKDIQLPVLACPDSPCAARLNAGDGWFKGVEAELFARPVQGLQIDAAASYLDFKYTSLNPTAAYPNNPGGAAKNDPPAATPKWKWSVGAQYEIPLGDAVGSLTPRFDVSHEGKIYVGPFRDAANVRHLTFLPSYTTANARITWKNPDDDLEASLEVTNLFNKYYFLTNFDLRGVGEGFDKGQPARPREWAVTVRKKF
ncbi:MAG: TonB-dependent receptor [Sphingomonadales bacterium]